MPWVAFALDRAICCRCVFVLFALKAKYPRVHVLSEHNRHKKRFFAEHSRKFFFLRGMANDTLTVDAAVPSLFCFWFLLQDNVAEGVSERMEAVGDKGTWGLLCRCIARYMAVFSAKQCCFRDMTPYIALFAIGEAEGNINCCISGGAKRCCFFQKTFFFFF